jgi:polyphosphate kinase 2 (PPK2 family)
MSNIKTFESWTITSTYNISDNTVDSKHYRDIDRKSVVKFINDYRKMFNGGMDIKSIKDKAKEEFGEELFHYLELDSFFKALKIKYKLNPTLAIGFFDEYVSEIPIIFQKIENDFSEYNLEDKFSRLKILKDEKKQQRKTSKKIFNGEINALFVEFLKMLDWIKKNNQKILITIDGRDSSGKGSFIKLIENNMPEKIVSHEWFDVPTPYQKRNWFHRYIKALPKSGHLKVYDRSWYNRAINDPVNGYCTEDEYKKFMSDVVPFEKKLQEDGVTHIKMWFSIDKETQEFRFDVRKAHPLKYWKFSPSDAKALDKFDKFTFYKEQMFAKTSTKKSPWIVVDMNDKKLGQLNAIKCLLNKIPYTNKNEKIIKPSKNIVYEL